MGQTVKSLEKFNHTLPLPKIMDMTKNGGTDIGHIKIINQLHKYSPNAISTGLCPSNPIFGSKFYVAKKHECAKCANSAKIISNTLMLPFFKFKKGQPVNLKFENKTGYSFDLHWHGLNTTANVDGASTETEFGVDTKIGTNLMLAIPKITNNSALLWVHAHPMFTASAYVYSGVFSLVDIVDDESECITKLFDYGDNHIALVYEDLEFNSDGTSNSQNLYTDAERSNFGVINGISCINWHSNKPSNYVVGLYHTSSKNLVKIDILNGSFSFRNIYVGVCDKNNKIKPFYLIQTDTGFRNPELMKMVNISLANRNSILIDLNKFEDKKAYIFMYNFDLTEVFDITLNNTNQLLEAAVPDLEKSCNPTPNPTPIPDPNSVNAQENPTNLVYPYVPAIPQTNEVVPNGNQIAPQHANKPFSIKKFLKIKLDNKQCQQNQLESVVHGIRKLVFGPENYCLFKEIINKNNFEYDKSHQINYISLLNKNYFYNLPEIDNVPTRNFIFFPDDEENAIPSNPYGATEYIDGANRIIVDLWNSIELDLAYAITQYSLSPNNYLDSGKEQVRLEAMLPKSYQPNILPSCMFKILPTNMQYINYNMIENDILKIQFFDQVIIYGDNKPIPIAEVTIVFPATTKPLNINQWKSLVMEKFNSTNVNFIKDTVLLGDLLGYDWTFYPYHVAYLVDKVQYIKSVLIKNQNKSNFYIKLIGKWQLLQFFGKPMAADTLEMAMTNNTMTMRTTNTNNTIPMTNTGNTIPNNCIIPNPGMDNMFPNNKNILIQTIYPQYATNDPENPIMTFDGTAELIIKPNSTYYGPIDGFMNDDLMNFSVKKNTSEKWIYHNMDTQDTHPFHFHLTSGFVDVFDPVNSPDLVSINKSYTNYLYSKDTYAIGSQQTLGFYLKFPNYTSEDTGSKQSDNVKNLGYMYHCHYMTHHDMSMMGQYFVYENRLDYF
jgi:FtsP/CotA-like multicopper oxidase with cupredoxin domain